MQQKDYETLFRTEGRSLAGKGHREIMALREEALSRFLERGYPSLKEEDWMYIPLAPLRETPFTLPTEKALPSTLSLPPPLFAGEPGEIRLFFVNGIFNKEISSQKDLPEGLTITPLRTLLEADPDRYLALKEETPEEFLYPENNPPSPFDMLNAAFAEEGVIVEVLPGATIPKPIRIFHLMTAASGSLMASPLNFLRCGKGSHATLIEEYHGEESSLHFTNAVTKVLIGENATLFRHLFIRENAQGSHLSSFLVEQKRDSRFFSTVMTTGGRYLRHNLLVKFSGENAEAVLSGLALAKDEEKVIHHTRLFHLPPRCKSRQVYKGITEGKSRSVFNGMIVVFPGAAGSDASQINKNLLLSPQAACYSRPQLEIHAGDVKCSHGSSVGDLDKEALYYLMSRGLAPSEARSLLKSAFARELLRFYPEDPLKIQAEAFIREGSA